MGLDEQEKLKREKLKKILKRNGKNKRLLVEILFLLITLAFAHNIGGIAFFIFLFYLIFKPYVISYFNFKNMVREKSIEELEKIEKEINYPLWSKKEYYIITESYLIGRILEFFIIDINDIILVYGKATYSGAVHRFYVIIVTKYRERVEIAIDRDKSVEFEEIIKAKNPNVLFGYNLKNVKEIKEKYSFIVYR